MIRTGVIGPFLIRWLRSDRQVLLLSAVLFGVLAPVTPGLATPANLANLLANLLPLLVVATGQTLVMIAGGIDLSVTATIALSSVTGAAVMNETSGWLAGHWLAVPAGLAAMLAVGAAVGAVNGTAVVVLRMPPFIVTLTTMIFFSGLAVWLTQSRNLYGLPPGFLRLGGQLLPAFLLSLGLAGLAHLLLTRTVAGRWLHAVGYNPRTAKVSGVPVGPTLLGSYLLCGLFASVASALYTARLETGSPILGQRILLDVIGAVVLGGTSLFGGRGRILWTVYGVVFLTLLDNALNLLGGSHFLIMMVKGVVILLAAALDTLRRRAEAS